MSAPPILAYESLSLQQGAGWLFQDIDLFIGPRDRLALIGRNGAGKTTLLRLIGAQIEADKGTRTVSPGANIVMLEQDPDFGAYQRLIDFALHEPKAPPEYAVRAIAADQRQPVTRPDEQVNVLKQPACALLQG